MRSSFDNAGLWFSPATILVLLAAFATSAGLRLIGGAAGFVNDSMTAVALFISLIAMRDSRRIAESMSTRYIGKFPKNMPAVIKLVESATRTLRIVSDHVGYGQFSDPAGFDQYKEAVHQRIAERHVGVDIGVYAESEFHRVTKSQLDCMTRDFVTFTSSQVFERFARWRPGLAEKMRESPQAFFGHLLENEKVIRDEFLGFRARVHTTANHMPVYMWIADDSHAIFCVMVRKDSSDLEYAFETRDGNLIKALMAMSDAYIQSDAEQTTDA